MQILRCAYLGLAVALAGCATQGLPKEVDVPVAVHCKPNLGPDPNYPDTPAALRAAPDLFTRVKLLVEGRLMRIQREQELKAALQACE